MAWIDDRFKDRPRPTHMPWYNKTGTGPKVMPRPGDPGYTMADLEAAKKRREAYNNRSNSSTKPGASPVPNSARENQLELSRQALRDAVNIVNSPSIATPSTPTNPLDLIFQQLLANSQMSANTMSDKQIRKLAEEQIRMQFDPQIKMLKQDMKERQERYKRNKEEVLDLYRDLANQYKGDGSGAGDAYANAINQENAQRQMTDQTLQENYQNSLDYQSNEFAKLGIEDVAQINYPQQTKDLEYQQTLNNAESDAFNRYAMQNQAADVSYYDKMAKNAGLHGAESVDDLLQELNSYLDSTGTQLTSIRSQQGTALNQLIAQMLDQQKQQQAQIQQDNWNRLLQSGQFGLNLQQMQAAQQQASTQQQQQDQGPTSGLLGANNMLANTSNPQQISGMFQQLLQTQPFREGRFQAADGTIVKLSPEQAANEALKMAQQYKLSPQDTTAFINAVYAYYGRLGR